MTAEELIDLQERGVILKDLALTEARSQYIRHLQAEAADAVPNVDLDWFDLAPLAKRLEASVRRLNGLPEPQRSQVLERLIETQ